MKMAMFRTRLEERTRDGQKDILKRYTMRPVSRWCDEISIGSIYMTKTNENGNGEVTYVKERKIDRKKRETEIRDIRSPKRIPYT